ALGVALLGVSLEASRAQSHRGHERPEPSYPPVDPPIPQIERYRALRPRERTLSDIPSCESGVQLCAAFPFPSILVRPIGHLPARSSKLSCRQPPACAPS